MRILGVNCTTQAAYLALVDDGSVVTGLPERLRPAEGVEYGERLLEFISDARRALAQMAPGRVGLLLPEGRQPGATYRRLAPRIAIETLIRVAAAQEGLPLDMLERATIRGRLALPRKGSLEEYIDKAGNAVGKYWRPERALAALAAMSMEND